MLSTLNLSSVKKFNYYFSLPHGSLKNGNSYSTINVTRSTFPATLDPVDGKPDWLPAFGGQAAKRFL
jgi:hypothetical protein